MAASATVGAIRAELTLATNRFSSGLRKAGGDLDRFGRRGQKNVRGLSRRFFGLKSAILGAAAALGAFRAFRGLTNLASQAVDTEAAFQSYGVRLKALLGSQQETNIALENFIDISKKTPFALQDIVGAGAVLGSVALGNRKKIEELTLQAANIAAVTGIAISSAAVNLQRALASGIGAADLLRERGVKQLIESITGLPDLAKVSSAELTKSFADVFGTGGTLGKLAEELSFTLGGALSNVGDASTRFKQKLGDALSPAVVGVAKGAFIPFFDDMAAAIFKNREEIGRLATEGIILIAKGLILAVRRAADFLIAIEQMINGLGGLKQISLDVGNAMTVFFQTVAVAAIGLRKEFENVRIDFLKLDLLTTVAAEKGSFADFLLPDSFTRTAEAISEVEQEIADAREEVKLLGRLSDIALGNVTDALIALNQVNPPGEDSALSTAAGLLTTIADKAQEAIPRIRAISEETQQRRRDKDAATDKGKDKLPKPDTAERKEQAKAFSDATEALAASLRSNVEGALIGAFQGKGFDAAQFFSKASGDLFKFSMDKALNSLQDTFEGFFEGIAEKFGDALGENASAAVGAAIGLLATLLSGALKKTKTTSTFADIKGGAESTQAVRGLVVGPTNIAIAQVNTAIADAFVLTNGLIGETNSILLQQLAVQKAFRNAAGGAALVESGSSASSLNSTSLG